MEFEDLKLAAYLNEASEDPAEAAAVLEKNGIKHACLRRAWGRDISRMTDDACGMVKDLLEQHKIKPVLLCSTIGDVPIHTIIDQVDDLDRALLICKFLNCPALQLHLGAAAKTDMAQKFLKRWMDIVTTKCLTFNVKPVFELDYHQTVSSPAEIANAIKGFRSWSIIYDPAVLIARRKVQPFTKFWSLLRDRVAFFDIHDYSTTPKPPGHGDAQLDLALNDAVIAGYNGWYCLEPGLGRRYNDLTSKTAIFEYSLEAFKALFKRLDMGPLQAQKHTKWYKK